MNQHPGVILRTIEAGFFKAPPKAHPSNIYVVSYNDGRVRAFTGVPSATDRWGSRFCYIVDTSEQRVRQTFRVPSSVDAYSFDIDVDATWKVTDAEAVVRANLSNGNDVVLGSLYDEVWVIARRYRPEDALSAEENTRQVLGGTHELAEGVTVLRATARFRVDDRLNTASRERDEDTHEGNRQRHRLQTLRDMFDGSDDSMMLIHLMQHPEDTGSVLQMMVDARKHDVSTHLDLLDRMLEHKLITDADAQPLRDRVLGPGIAPSVTMRPISGRRQAAGLASGLPQPDQPAQPARSAPDPAPDPAPDQASAQAAGGVKKWKELKKPDQGTQ